jgi:hypothetical protein
LGFLLLPALVVGVVVMLLSGLVRPSRSRRVQSLIDDVFSGRGE